MAQPKVIADFEAQLATAIAIGDTTFSLSSATDDDGVALPSGLYYFTIDNGQSNKEYLAGTLSGTSVTAVLNVSRQGVETSGAVRAHRVGASVLLTDFATYKKYIDQAAIAGAVDADASTKGIVEIAIAAEIDSDSATGSTGAPIAVTPDQIATSKYGTLLSDFTALSASLSGIVSPYAGRTAPTGWLMCDGSLVSRATYAALFAVLCPSGTFTVTIASPAVFSKTGHGLVEGDRIHLTTTGGLPSGLAANTDYFVIATGLTSDAFEVALTPGGAAVNTSGSQSGVHTLYASAWGKGDGSTTFALPDLRSKVPVGLSASAPTTTLTFAGSQRSGNNITILDNVFPSQGQKVQLTTTGALPTGLSLATDYWIIRVSTTSIAFATTQANANAGTAVTLSGDGSGINTITFTNRAHTVLGKAGGEDKHGVSIAELAAHTHDGVSATGGSNANPTNASTYKAVTGSTGGDSPHNNMQPFAVVNYIIKT